MDPNLQIILSSLGILVLLTIALPIFVPAVRRFDLQMFSQLRSTSHVNVALEIESTKLEKLADLPEVVHYEQDAEDAQKFAMSLAKNYGVVAFYHCDISDDPSDPGRIFADMFDALDIKVRWVDVQGDISLPIIFKQEVGPQVWIGGSAVGDFLNVTELAVNGGLRALLDKHKITYNSERFAIFEKA